MTTPRTLAEAIEQADDRWQHGVGSGSYPIDGPVLGIPIPALADVIHAWLRERAADPEVVEAVARAISQELGEGGEWSPEARAALAAFLEALGGGA